MCKAHVVSIGAESEVPATFQFSKYAARKLLGIKCAWPVLIVVSRRSV